MLRTRSVLAAVLAALTATPAVAATGQGGDLRWAPPDAAAFVRLLPRDLWEGPAGRDLRAIYAHAQAEAVQAFRQHAGIDPADLRRVTLVFPTLESLDQPFPRGNPTAVSAVFVLESARPFDRPALLRALSTDGRVKRQAGADYFFHEEPWGALYLADDGTALYGSEDAVLWVLARARAQAGPLTPALRLAAGRAPVVAGFNPALMPPAALLAAPEPVAGLLRADCLAAALDLSGGQLTLTASAHFRDAAAAAAGKKALQGALGLGRQGLSALQADLQKNDPEDERNLGDALARAGALGFLRLLDGALEKADVGVDGDAAWAAVSSEALGAPGTPLMLLAMVTMLGQNAHSTFQFVGPAVGGPGREVDPGLRALHDALERYHKDHGHYPPPALTGKDGRPLLSWRVALLPYLGEEGLYKEFRLDEPWDSLHNKKLIARMPKALRGGQEFGEVYRTCYLGVAGPGAVFEGPAAKKRDDFKGGPGQPLLAVRVANELSVYWTKPADLVVTPQAPLPRLAGRHGRSVNVLFADGEVRVLDVQQTPEAVLRGLATGREKLPPVPRP
jgi:prepilin-type processing-associated H-X9-DG protein